MDELKSIIRQHGKYINVYIGKETVTDQLEESIEITYYSPNRIKGMLEDLSVASAVYKMPGINTTKSKIFVCHKSYRTLFENSHKIEINNEIYYGYKDGAGSNIVIKEEGSYIRVYLKKKLFV